MYRKATHNGLKIELDCRHCSMSVRLCPWICMRMYEGAWSCPAHPQGCGWTDCRSYADYIWSVVLFSTSPCDRVNIFKSSSVEVEIHLCSLNKKKTYHFKMNKLLHFIDLKVITVFVNCQIIYSHHKMQNDYLYVCCNRNCLTLLWTC